MTVLTEEFAIGISVCFATRCSSTQKCSSFCAFFFFFFGAIFQAFVQLETRVIFALLGSGCFSFMAVKKFICEKIVKCQNRTVKKQSIVDYFLEQVPQVNEIGNNIRCLFLQLRGQLGYIE